MWSNPLLLTESEFDWDSANHIMKWHSILLALWSMTSVAWKHVFRQHYSMNNPLILYVIHHVLWWNPPTGQWNKVKQIFCTLDREALNLLCISLPPSVDICQQSNKYWSPQQTPQQFFYQLVPTVQGECVFKLHMACNVWY